MPDSRARHICLCFGACPVLEAIHSRVYEAHPFYKEEPEHGPYELQADLHVKLDTFSLDEHHADVAEIGLNHVDFLRCELEISPPLW